LSLRVWPTPAHGAMGIAWSLPSRAEARVLAFDAAGRAVREVARGEHGPGEHVVRWDGTSTAGERVVPGVYFIQVRASGTRVTRRVVLLD
jgi:flagellar hook assembly protein FlgD